MPSFKSSALARFTTPEAVRRLTDLLALRVLDTAEREQEVSDQLIDTHIIEQQNVVSTFLRSRYGSALTTDAYSNMPISLSENGDPSNKLLGFSVVAANAPVTEQWVVKCTETGSAYSVIGSISGSQGAGAFNILFTADDGDITIPVENWQLDEANEVQEDDIFVGSVFTYQPIVVLITNYLACAAVLRYILSGESINNSSMTQRFHQMGMDLLNKLMKGEIELSSKPSVSIDPVALPYRVDQYGIDSTRGLPDPDFGGEYRTDNIPLPGSDPDTYR